MAEKKRFKDSAQGNGSTALSDKESPVAESLPGAREFDDDRPQALGYARVEERRSFLEKNIRDTAFRELPQDEATQLVSKLYGKVFPEPVQAEAFQMCGLAHLAKAVPCGKWD